MCIFEKKLEETTLEKLVDWEYTVCWCLHLVYVIYVIDIFYFDGNHFKYSFVMQMERQKDTFIVRQRHENWTVF